MSIANQRQAETRLALADIESVDSPFNLGSGQTISTALESSVREYGILSPVWVHALPGTASVQEFRYRLVHGFRRFFVAERLGLNEIAAIVMDGGDLPGLFRTAVSENHASRAVSLLEKVHALRALTRLGVPEEVLIKDLPLLGFPAKPAILSILQKLQKCPPGLLRELSDRDCPLRRLAAVVELDAGGQAFLAELCAALKPSLNELELAARLLGELARKERRSSPEIVTSAGIPVSLEPAAQLGFNMQKILGALFARRYPELSAQRSGVADLLARIRLPKMMKIRWDDTLEKSGIIFQADLNSQEDVESFLKMFSDPELAETLRQVVKRLAYL